ncbi:MAG: hypothetical protein IMY73_04585 [Bacteroidetes bacterium]|nr:hypothetical protein [Bacteroidota bacterium]
MNKYLLLIFSIICYSYTVNAQEQDSSRLSNIKIKLDSLANIDKMYLKEVDLSTSKITLSNLLQAIANANGVNISIKGGENIYISSNFSRARIVDLLYFVCSEYNLDLEIIGNIVSVYPYKPTPIKNPSIIKYDSLNNKLSYDLIDQNLLNVAKDISTKSGKNIIVPQTLYSKNVSGYLTDVKFEESISILATINNLSIEEKQDDI